MQRSDAKITTQERAALKSRLKAKGIPEAQVKGATPREIAENLKAWLKGRPKKK